MIKDRRVETRVPVNLKITYFFDGKTYKSFSTDLSPTGIFIEAAVAPPINKKIDLHFNLIIENRTCSINVTGSVERIVDKNDEGMMFTIPGFGIKFSDFSDNSKKDIQEYISLKLSNEKQLFRQSQNLTSKVISDNASFDKIKKELENTSPLPKKIVDKFQKFSNKKNEIQIEKKVSTDKTKTAKDRLEMADEAYRDSLNAYRENDYEKALKFMQKATFLNPNKSNYFITLKDMEQAHKNNLILKACNLAEDLMNEKNYDEALKELKQCYDFAHNDQRILRLIAHIMALQNKNLVKALKFANQAYSLNPENAENIYILGLVFKKMGNFAKAKSFFQQAVNINNHNRAAKELIKLLM